MEELKISSFTNLLWKVFHNVMRSLISVLIFSLLVGWTNEQVPLQSDTILDQYKGCLLLYDAKVNYNRGRSLVIIVVQIIYLTWVGFMNDSESSECMSTHDQIIIIFECRLQFMIQHLMIVYNYHHLSLFINITLCSIMPLSSSY